MKKLRKIVAAVLGAATVVAVAVTTASAASIKLGAVTATNSPDFTISYTQFDPYYDSYYSINTVSFSGVSKDIKEGDVFFAVDFNKESDRLAGKSSKLTAEEKKAIPEYMASIRLDKSLCFYTGAKDSDTKYVLEVTDSYKRNQKNVILGKSYSVFSSRFDITSATAEKKKDYHGNEYYQLTFDYKIDDHYVIPSWFCLYGSSANNPYFYNTKFNGMSDGTSASTTGKLQLGVEDKYIGKSTPIIINGFTVAYMTISSSGKVTFTNC